VITGVSNKKNKIRYFFITYFFKNFLIIQITPQMSPIKDKKSKKADLNTIPERIRSIAV
jgi:hypothetical protein